MVGLIFVGVEVVCILGFGFCGVGVWRFVLDLIWVVGLFLGFGFGLGFGFADVLFVFYVCAFWVFWIELIGVGFCGYLEVLVAVWGWYNIGDLFGVLGLWILWLDFWFLSLGCCVDLGLVFGVSVLGFAVWVGFCGGLLIV